MNGADYIATVRLSTKQNEALADVGETCERVPAESLTWLAEQGLIVLPQPLGTTDVELASAEAVATEAFDDDEGRYERGC